MQVKIIECPRDAMQGIKIFIPTKKKIDYINQLLKVGFDTLDFGSFVSPKSIPQLKDTADVLNKLKLESTNSKLLAIVANKRGAEDTIKFEEIKILGFPFSISETFQQRNTNSTIQESLKRVEDIKTLCTKNNKDLVVYISMGFGNPYGDKWDSEIVVKWIEKLAQLDIKIIQLSDTIGVANSEIITYLFSHLIPNFSDVEIGAHFHTTPDRWEEKINAAYQNGCKRFDGAIKGFGGCPMAEDELTGNMPTENLISFFKNKKIELNLDMENFHIAEKMSLDVFPLN